ncbi:MAG TPA: co-chaperone DjlA [Steroidobacteraceae bacterium]|jgi:DnaJ like chaperone protein|nr:co-chaperone DjlA [Steroidobacteraceae bacterium]
MSWTGKILGALIGFVLTRQVLGALIGALVGHMLDHAWDDRAAAGGARAAGGSSFRAGIGGAASIAEEFFRSTFEIMGNVAKSDGRVSEAEIDAARRLMQDLKLGPRETELAIECFRRGKTPGYDVEIAVERLREACGQRHDLLRAFLELQLRAALAGNGMSPPARAILVRVAERLGMSGLEFAYMEASLRTWRSGGERAPGGRSTGSLGSLAECYAVLEVDSGISDPEVTKAYRRQMSRHHPDKLVANGLPESMAQLAKERTQRIQEAYEGIRAARGMR